MKPRERAAALAALGLAALLLQLAHAQSTLPAPQQPHAYWQVKPASHVNGRMRYRLQLLGRGYCSANSRGFLSAPNCNEWSWHDLTPRLNTWQVFSFGQWDLQPTSRWSRDPDTPVMNTPLAVVNVGRAFPWGCGGSEYLSAPGCGSSARLSSSWRHSSRWLLEPVPGRPYVFYISALTRDWYGYRCASRYLGAARACRPGGNPRLPEDPCLGLYALSNTRAATMWQLIPVNPCAVQSAPCTSSAQCCQEQGLKCVASVCAAPPNRPGFSGNAPQWWDPNLTLQLDLTEPTNDGGAAVTLYRVTGQWGSGADAKTIEANSTTFSVVFSGNRYPWLCGKRWRFQATAANGAGASPAFAFSVTTEACRGPEGLTYKAFVPGGGPPISLDVQLNPPTNTFGLLVTQYGVQLEYQGAANTGGLLQYSRDSATPTVTFPGADFPLLCGRLWAATAWAATSGGRSEDVAEQWDAPECPSPDPPAGAEGARFVPNPPNSDPIIYVTVQPSPQTWGFATETYLGTIRSQDGQLECQQESSGPELSWGTPTCGGVPVCGRTWDLYASVVTASGQQSAERVVAGFITVPAC